MNSYENGRQYIHPDLLAKIDAQNETTGVFLKDLPDKTTVKVCTRNSIYLIQKDGEAVYMSGGVIGNRRKVNFHGCTFGGSMIKVGWIGMDMHLEWSYPGEEPWTSTRIRSVSIITEKENSD